MSLQNTPPPRLPDVEKDVDKGYITGLLRALRLYFNSLFTLMGNLITGLETLETLRPDEQWVYSYEKRDYHGTHVHLKTNVAVTAGLSQMAAFRLSGYDFNTPKPIAASGCFYSYIGSLVYTGSTGSHTISYYVSADNFVVIVLNTTGGYYTGFSMTQVQTAVGITPFTITAVGDSASTTGVF
jgi:hypothetical protein